MKKDLVKRITRKNKKNNKNNKKSISKNKVMIGGRPKISFPYTYFILSYDNFMKYYNILNPYLTAQTNACNNKGSGVQDIKYEYKEQIPSFLNDNSEVCILVLKYDDAFNLNHSLNFFNEPSFLNKILGHAKLKYYNNLSLLGIFNVCQHLFDISIDTQRNIIPQLKVLKEGYGTVLFNCVKTSTSFLPFDFNQMWLGIDINNVGFKKVAWLYTANGFEDPIFSNISPDGIILPFYTIQLSSKKYSYINNRDDASIPYLETIDLYNQIQTPLGQEGIFKFKFNFDKSAILSLRLMPFISFSEEKKPIGIEDYSKQRETSGRFLIYDSYEDNNDIINKLSLELLGEQSVIKYNIGEMGEVEVIPGQRTFHTHPYINYKIHNTLIGPPSAPDLYSLIDLISKYMQIPMSKIPQFGAVIAIEGIYIFSLSIDGIRHLKNGRILYPIDIINYEYPFDKRQYDWSTYANDSSIQEDIVNNEIKKYFTWFENVNKKFDNYFKMDFKPWKEVNENTQFELYYYNGNRMKIIPDTRIAMEVANHENGISTDDVKMEIVEHENRSTNGPQLGQKRLGDEVTDDNPPKIPRFYGGKKRTNKTKKIKQKNFNN